MNERKGRITMKLMWKGGGFTPSHWKILLNMSFPEPLGMLRKHLCTYLKGRNLQCLFYLCQKKIILQGPKVIELLKSIGQFFTTGKYTLYIRILKYVFDDNQTLVVAIHLFFLSQKILRMTTWHSSDSVFSILLSIFISIS